LYTPTLDQPTATRPRLTLLSMCAATFMISLDLTIVNVALPSLQRQLRLTPGDLEWVVSAYALSLAALVPLGGALGDRFGRKLVFLSGMAIFAIGSVACALSPDAAALIAARAVQGVGGAAMLALALSIITETFPPERRAAAIGVWAAIGGTGFGAGPVAGGVLLTFFGWASAFWVNLPFAAIGLVGTALAVRESRDLRKRRLDLTGAVMSAGGLTAVALGLIESSAHAWTSLPVAAPLLAGTALLIGFWRWERRAPQPMMPPVLLRSRSFLGAAGIYLFGYLGLSGALFYVTLLYQDVDGWPVLRTGLSWLLMNVPFLLTANLAGRLSRRFRPVAVVAGGCLVAAVGVLALSRATDTTPFALSAVGYVLFGGGFGAFVPGTTHLAMRDVPPGASGSASGLLNAARQLGASIGLALLGAIGVHAAVADWQSRSAAFPPGSGGATQAQNVGGARIGAVTQALGTAYRRPAVDAFLHGYHLAVGVSAGCLVAAAVIAIVTYGNQTE
jgi:EmrB/QacA subfamily drug resistance transporter